MAIKNLYFKYAEGFYIRLEYNDDTKTVSAAEQYPSYPPDSRLNAPPNDVPAFLGSKTNSVPADGSDLYLQKDGDVLYRVRKSSSSPYGYVTSSFFKPLAATVSKQNVTQFGYADGSFGIALKDGSGYVYTDLDAPGTPAHVLGNVPDVDGLFLRAGTYEKNYRDALTSSVLDVSVVITEPACTLLIDNIAVTAESAPAANDGQITVTANCDNPIEYSLDNNIFQDSPVFAGLPDGEYTLYARDKNQLLCRQQKPVFVGSLPCDLVISRVDLLHESFLGQADGRINVLATSEREIEYALGNGSFQDTNIFYGLAPGSYTLKARLKAANTCQMQVTDTIQPGVELLSDITNVACGDSPTGQIDVYVGNTTTANNNLPLNFLWYDGLKADAQYSSVHTKLKPGAHQVTVTTVNGRSKIFTYTVTGQPPIVIEATIDQDQVFLNVSGGNPPYTFLWLDGATSQNRSGLAPGTYLVTVTDSTGCKKTENIFVRIAQHYFSENPVALEIFALDLETKPNFTFVCEVYLEQQYLSGEFLLIAELEQPVDAEGKTVFQVEEYLNAFLEPALPVAEAGIRRLDSQFKRFFLRYTEKYGLLPELSDFSQQETFYVLLGGLSFEEYATRSFFTDYLTAQKPFYTWQPIEKEVSPEQPEFLYYACPDKDLDTFQVHMKLYYPDGTEAIHRVSTVDNILQHELYAFPAGYDQLSIRGYSCQSCYQYDIYVTDAQDTIISEIRRYTVNHEYYEHKRFFFFLNSLGCFDTLACTGRASYELKTREEKAARLLPYNYKPTDRATETVSKYGEMEVNVPVGYPTPEMMQRLQDFVLSKEYYLYEHGRLVPVEIDIRKATILDENEDLPELEFTYMPPRLSKFAPLLKAALNGNTLEATQSIAPGSISLEVTGGTAPYSYLWSDGATTQNRTNIAIGSYAVRISDSNTPKKVISLCAIDVLEGPPPIEEQIPEFPYNAHFRATQDYYYQDSPGYKWVNYPGSWPDGTIIGHNNITLGSFQEGSSIPQKFLVPAGTTRFEMYIYIPSEHNITGMPKLEFSPINSVVQTFLQTADASLKDVWQKLETEIVLTQGRELYINVKDIYLQKAKYATPPTCYLSDYLMTTL